MSIEPNNTLKIGDKKKESSADPYTNVSVRNSYLLKQSESDLVEFESISYQSNLTLNQLRVLSVLILQVITFQYRVDIVSPYNVHSQLSFFVKTFTSKFNSNSNNLDHTNVKLLRSFLFLITVLYDIACKSDCIDSLEAVLLLSKGLISEVVNGANAIKLKERERMALYCRTLGIFGSSCKL